MKALIHYYSGRFIGVVLFYTGNITGQYIVILLCAVNYLYND